MERNWIPYRKGLGAVDKKQFFKKLLFCFAGAALLMMAITVFLDYRELGVGGFVDVTIGLLLGSATAFGSGPISLYRRQKL